MVYLSLDPNISPQGQKHTQSKKISKHAQIRDNNEMRGNTKRKG
jgi:hypothetical protein